MPKYEWRCQNQQCPMQVFEVILKMQQIEEGYHPACPMCDYPAERVMSTFNGNFGDTEIFFYAE